MEPLPAAVTLRGQSVPRAVNLVGSASVSTVSSGDAVTPAHQGFMDLGPMAVQPVTVTGKDLLILSVIR